MYNPRGERNAISTNRCTKSKYLNDVVGFQNEKEIAVGEKRDDLIHTSPIEMMQGNMRQKNLKLN
jgi:hypothetical protein